jgi:hypothetical protein
MLRILTCFLLTACFWCTAFGQSDAQDSKSKKLLEKAANNGNSLVTQIPVNGNVHAQAVLIPQIDARRIFGKEIAKNYAVIEVNVGNKSPDAALIIQGIYIDYSRWPLSGSTGVHLDTGNDSYQASTSPNHVASEEYRVVRGQLLDAQNSTWRNRLLRWLTFAGNLASAYTFSINETGIIQGIASATGVGIPGLATALPDPTIEQLNRVSDFGFQTNKVIGKQGSDVIVCFFPIDRFLTPGFKKLFLRSPALFFAPLQMLEDRTVEKDVSSILGTDLELGVSAGELRRLMPCYLRVTQYVERREESMGLGGCFDEFGLVEKIELNKKGDVVSRKLDVKSTGNKTDGFKTDANSFAQFKKFMAIDFIRTASLNNVVVTIDGVMSVDINTIAPRTDAIQFARIPNCGTDKDQCFWTQVDVAEGVRTGAIPGSYLSGGSIVIEEADDLGITEVKAVTENSSDKVLHFSFKLTKAIDSQTTLHFMVTKTPQGDAVNGKSLESLPREYVVDYATSAPGITSIKQEDLKLKVTGSGFSGLPLLVKLHSPAGDEVEVTPTLDPAHKDTQMVLTIPDDIKPAGCWSVVIKVRDVAAPKAMARFFVKPKPTLDSAVRDTPNHRIIITGDDLIDTTQCGGPVLSFRLQKDEGALKSTALIGFQPQTRRAAIKMPDEANEGAGWTVHVMIDGKEVAKIALE